MSVDPSHPLANATVLKRLTGGALEGMTGNAATTVVNARMASTTAGTFAYAREAFASAPDSCRVSGVVKVTKTSGRRSMIGFTSAPASDGSTLTVEVGYEQGGGIRVSVPGFTTTPAFGPTLLQEADCVDGAEYRVTLTYENVGLSGGATNGRLMGSVQNLDGTTPATALASWSDVRWDPASYRPRGIMARTNDNTGTIRDLTYVGSLFGVADDGGLIRTNPYENTGTTTPDRVAIWATGKAAPLRVVITAGGSGNYGGQVSWGQGAATGDPFPALRRFWSTLARAGYVVVHPHALHEGWGHDTHLAMQLQALNRIKAAYGTDVELFYVGWSMGGFSVWRSILGKAGFPSIKAAYIVAGAIDLSRYRNVATLKPGLEARWGTNPATDDNPIDYPGADFIARGTRVLLANGDVDAEAPLPAIHDVMKTKYAGSSLFSEHIYAGHGHFSPVYWEAAAAAEVVEFFGATPDPGPGPDPETPEVAPPPSVYIPEILVDGINADVDTVRVQSDTPAHLGIPPNPGAIAGADASLTWEHGRALSTQAENPWHGDWRPVAGAGVTIDIPGPDGRPFRAFTGVVDRTNVALGGAPLQSSCVDPLADTTARFSAPALMRYMPGIGAHTPADRRRVNARSIWYAERALEAIGARSTVPRSVARTEWHQSMCGSTWPAYGRIDVSAPLDPATMQPIPAPTANKEFGALPDFESMGDGSGRVACINPYVVGTIRARPALTGAAVTLAHELDPTDTGANYAVWRYATGSLEGFGLKVNGSDVRVLTRTSGGTETTRFTIPRAGASRILVRYNPSSGSFAAAVDSDPADMRVTSVSLGALDTGRLSAIGAGRVGAISVYRDGAAPDVDPYLTWPRQAAFHIPPLTHERWRLLMHPPVVDEPAVSWLTQRAHVEQALLWTDHYGVTHWADVRQFDDAPVVGEITDAVVTGGTTEGIVGLDDLTYTDSRPAPYSRIRVTGLRGWPQWSYLEYPSREAVRATETVKLEAGDPPVELWLEPRDGGFWFGSLDLRMRRAGGPFGKDFEKLRGSWFGGHVVNDDGDVLRWALDDDVTVDVEEVGVGAVKVTLTPGTGLAAGETFINLPRPDSVGLENYPEVKNAPLPVLTAWAHTPAPVQIDGVSTDIGPSNRPEYVHEGGWSFAFQSGPGEPGDMAQAMADRHVNHVGEVTVQCEAAPVRIGERWHVRVQSVADLLMDAVVIGVPDLTASAGQASMTLRLWVMSADAPGDPLVPSTALLPSTTLTPSIGRGA